MPFALRPTVLSLVIALGFAAGKATDARTIRVPDDVFSLSTAVDHARPGDRIEVAPGVWSPSTTGERFPLILVARDLEIVGAGAGRTILDAEGRSRHFVFTGGDASLVSGMTLTRGSARLAGGSILVEDASPGLHRLHIREASAEHGGDAVWVAAGEPRLRQCLIEGNGGRGPTLLLEEGRVHLEHITVVANAGPALEIGRGAEVVLRNSVVARPGTGGGASVGIVLSGGQAAQLPRLERNLFSDCFAGIVQGDPDRVWDLEARSEEWEGMVEDDPLFVDGSARDYRLQLDSPARFESEDPESGEPTEDQLGAYGGPRPLGLGAPEATFEEGTALLDDEDEEEGLLGPSVPNPFTPSTTIHFSVPEATVVDLGIYNILGQRVRTLHAGDMAAGEHTRIWDGRDDLHEDVPPGIYFVRVTQGTTTESRRIVLVR
jgi:hypothetical protein